jgi:hypothetical protein
MKKIDLMYFDKKNDAFFVEFVIKKCENVSLFLKKDNRLFIKSKFSPIQELKINMTVVTLDEKFSNGLIKLIYKVHDIVPTIKTSDPAESQDYSIQHPDRIEAVIFSLVNKFSYENRGILEFISLLLIRIARAHA